MSHISGYGKAAKILQPSGKIFFLFLTNILDKKIGR